MSESGRPRRSGDSSFDWTFAVDGESRAAARTCAPYVWLPGDRCSGPERPATVEDRAVPGDGEGELITGAGNKSAIWTLVERATCYVMLLHLPGAHGAVEVEDEMIRVMSELPATLRRTLTWDQGQEMRNHARIAAATDMDVYFCDPGSPWQRGSNENTNGLLRQYFQKSTDLSGYHRDYLEFRRDATQQPAAQTPRMEDTRRSDRPTTLRPARPTSVALTG